MTLASARWMWRSRWRGFHLTWLGQLLLCSVFGTDVSFRTKVSVLLAVLSFGPPRVAEPWGRSPSLRSVAADTELAQDVASHGCSLPPSWRA